MNSNGSTWKRFDLTGRVAVITGGSGLLGREHAIALADCGAIPVLLDINSDSLETACEVIRSATGTDPVPIVCDITDEDRILLVLDEISSTVGKPTILVNNAANNPKVEEGGAKQWSRLENFPKSAWDLDVAVGLTGAFLCSRVFGADMADSGGGVILNIASDLALIGPDQRIYRKDGTPQSAQPVKPVTYSVVKAGLVGLTRYLATYWATAGVRCNALCPGGVENNQDPGFIAKLTNLIPLGRMASKEEYRAALAFLCSDASAYMTGAVIPMDGGRTVW
jgi:NAD(P)-dependent dehydrogenase (short-subunit alcohol dehydrogenase family)